MGNEWLDAIALGLQEGLNKARTRNQSTVDSLLPVLSKIAPTNRQTRETYTPEAAATHPGLAGIQLPEARTETTETPNPVFEQGMAAMQQANKGRLPFGISGAGHRGLEDLVRTIASANQQQRQTSRDEGFADLEREYQLGQKYGLDKFTRGPEQISPYERRRQTLEADRDYGPPKEGPQPTRRNLSYQDAVNMSMGEAGYRPSKFNDSGYANAQGADPTPEELQQAQRRAAELVRSGITQEPLGGGGRAPVGGAGEAGMAGAGDPQEMRQGLNQQLQQDIDDYTERFGQPPSDDDFVEMLNRRRAGGGMQRGF